MSRRFDDLSRAMAGPLPRRGALKVLGATLAAAVGAVFVRPIRGAAACPAGQVQCGGGCCSGTCSYFTATSGCCCEAGLTPCGTSCCKAGVACIDRARGRCGCPAGYTRCGTGDSLRCCPRGTRCTNSHCVDPRSPSSGTWIPCRPNGCRISGSPCFSNTECCTGLTCSCSNEGFSTCC
jgi:hypothetical protein